MKNMKQLLCGLLAVCLLSATALADVIWEPDDDFYQQHSEDCEYLGRSYYVNGPEGGAALYQNPGGGYVRVVENGVPLYISFTYTDLGGTLWGVAEYGDAGDTGWVDMADLLLIDLKDLRSMVQYVGDNAKEFKLTYGNISSQSVGAIQRSLLALEDEGGDIFFGEPALEIADWIDWAGDGRGILGNFFRR